MPSIQVVLNSGISLLKGVKIPSADLDAELLLAHILKKDRIYLIAHSDANISSAIERKYLALIKQRASRIPLAYLTGVKEFYGLDFFVSPATLIPRPETELLIDLALDYLQENTKASVIDVGTGTGAIAATIARHAPTDCIVMAVDISPAALTMARKNIRNLGVAHRVQVKKSDLFSSMTGRFDLICANLPYLSAEVYREAVKKFPELKYEPRGALTAPKKGLAYIEQLLGQVSDYLNPGGMILLEIEYEQGEEVKKLAKKYLPSARVEVVKDGCGLDRVVKICT